jgi:hypothetical protein
MKIVEDQEEYENVVDAEGFLDKKAGEEFQACLTVAFMEQNNPDVEEQGEARPGTEPCQRLFGADDMRAALEHAEVHS